MSMNPGFMPNMPNAGGQSRGWMPTSYARTGIPDITGNGYAYPPGSEMASFMDGLNMTVSRASAGPNGQGSVVDWAKGLAQQASMRKMGLTAPGGATGAGGSEMSLAAMMAKMQEMMAQIQRFSTQSGSAPRSMSA